MGKEVKISFAVIGILLLVFGAVLYRRLTQGNETVMPAASSGDVADETPTTNPRARQIAQADDPGQPPAVSLGGGWVHPASQTEIEPTAADPEPAPYEAQPPSPSLVSTIEPAENEIPEQQQQQVDQSTPADDTREVAPTSKNPFGSRSAQPRPADEYPTTNLPEEDSRLAPSSDPSTGSSVPSRARDSDTRRPARGEVLPAAQAAAGQPTDRFEEEPRQSFLARDTRQPSPDDSQNLDDGRTRGTAAGSATLRPRRIPVTDGKYTVEPNDNYWTISQKVYGTGGFFQAIQEHNKQKYPRAEKLQVGDVLSVPEAAILMQTYPKLCPKTRKAPPTPPLVSQASTRKRADSKTYVVEEGDTLFDIARYRLGKASRWAEIYDLNRDVLGEDFNYLQPGTALVMPSGPRDTEAMTRRSEESQQR